MLSKEVRAALETELGHLEERKARLVAKIDCRIDALKAVLAPEEDEQQRPTIRTVSLTDFDTATPNPLENAGLRDAIRWALQRFPNITSSYAAEVVERAGFTPGGETPLRVRVQNELHRMASLGLVTKQDNRFSLPPSVLGTDHGAGAA